MFLYVSNSRLNLIPYHMDLFSYFLGGSCPLYLESAADFQFTEIFIDEPKEFHDGLFLP